MHYHRPPDPDDIYDEGFDFSVENNVEDVFPDDLYQISARHPASGLVVALGALGLHIDPQLVRECWEKTAPVDRRRLRACLNLTILQRNEDSIGLQPAKTFGRLLKGIVIGPKAKKTNFTLPPPIRLTKMGGCTVFHQGIITTPTSTVRVTPEGYAYDVQGPIPFNMRVLDVSPQGAVQIGDKTFSLAALYNMAGRGKARLEEDEFSAVERCLQHWTDKINQSLPEKFTHRGVYENRKLFQLGGIGLASKIAKAEDAIARLAQGIATATVSESLKIFKRLKRMRTGPYSDVGKRPIGKFYDTTIAKQLRVMDYFARHERFDRKIIVLGLGNAHISHVNLPTFDISAYEIKKYPGQFARDAFSDEAFNELTNSFCMSDVFMDYKDGRGMPSDVILQRQLDHFPIMLASKTFSGNVELCPVVANYNKYYEVEIITGGRTHNTEIFLTFRRRPVPPTITDKDEIKAHLDGAYASAPFPVLSAKNIEQIMLAKFSRLSLYHSAFRNLAYVNGHTPGTLPPEDAARFNALLGQPGGLEQFESYRVSLVQRAYGASVGSVLSLQKIALHERESYRIVGNESRIIPIPESRFGHEETDSWLEAVEPHDDDGDAPQVSD